MHQAHQHGFRLIIRVMTQCKHAGTRGITGFFESSVTHFPGLRFKAASPGNPHIMHL